MNNEELAWAAGFFDGEGHCSFTNRKINLAVNQIDTYVLERFRNAVGGLGSIYNPKSRKEKNPKHNDIFVWKTSNFEHTQAVIAMLWNFLSPIKKNDITRAMIMCKEAMRGDYMYTERVFSYSGPTISRSDAIIQGLDRYFTGDSCVHGHTSQRWVNGRRCLGCRAERKKL